MEKSKLISELDSSILYVKDKRVKRIYGIDLLKIFAMINIINLHINRNSKLLKINPDNSKFKQIYRLEVFSFWPVNAFGLISGIIGFRKYKFSNLIYFYFENIFYSIFFSICLYLKSLLDLKNFILSFFPLGIKRFWYFNAYFFMFLILPFITSSINSINRNFYRKLIICYFFLYSIYHIVLDIVLGRTDFDFINGGYTSIWLLTLYIIGGYIGRFCIKRYNLSNYFFFGIYLISSFISSEYIFYCYKKNKPLNLLFLRYYSPTIIIQAISLIFFFSNIDISNKFIIKVISFFNPLNFNVALIHMRIFLFRTQSITKYFDYIKLLAPDYLFFKIYAISISIYLISSVFDYFRYLIFKLIKVRTLCIYIEKIIIDF